MNKEEKKSHRGFKSFLKRNQEGGAEDYKYRLTKVNEYKNQLPMMGGGLAMPQDMKKMFGKKLIDIIHQKGGSWGDFTNWFKKAANTVKNGVVNTAVKVGNAAKTAGQFVYNKGIKPAIQKIKEKPVSLAGSALGALGMIPSPYSAGLKAAGTALGAVGSAVGRGMQMRGGAVREGGHVTMVL